MILPSARSRAVLLIVALAASCAVPRSRARPSAPWRSSRMRSFIPRSIATASGAPPSISTGAADALKQFEGPASELNAKLGVFYAKRSGNRIARVELTDSGWKISGPAPFVLASGRPYDLFLVASNATNRAQEVRVSVNAGSPEPEDYPANYAKAQQAREQGGVALYAHPALRFDEIPTGSLASESVADIALGAVDGLEVFCNHDEPSMELWYRFLNLGFKLAVTGGSNAFLNNRFAFVAGGERMYVYTGDRFNYDAWIDGLKRGCTFTTVGPLLTFTVNGQIAGSELRFDENEASVPVRVSAVSSIPMSRIEIVANGRVIATQSSLTPSERIEWSGAVPLAESSWIAARVWGPNDDPIANGPSRWSQRRVPDLALLAHTSPVYVTLGGKRVFSAADRDFCLHWIDALVDRIRKQGNFSNDAHGDQVLAAFARVRQVYERMGEH